MYSHSPSELNLAYGHASGKEPLRDDEKQYENNFKSESFINLDFTLIVIWSLFFY